jgi:transposase InsO family protein
LALRRLRYNGWRIAHELHLSRATVKPGHRIHGDHTRDTRGAGYEYLHIAIDDHTRIGFAAILPDPTHRSALLFFMARAFYSRFGFSIRRVLTDNRACYRH